MACERAVHSPSNATTPSSQAILIEIPTNEFTNCSSPPPRPHPPRQKQPLHQKLNSATKAREASLQTLRRRCKHHVEHVVSVANHVKQKRAQTSSMHARRLSTALRDAEERRRKLQFGRAARLKEIGERRARVLRERDSEYSVGSIVDNAEATVDTVSNGKRLSNVPPFVGYIAGPRTNPRPCGNSSLCEEPRSDGGCHTPRRSHAKNFDFGIPRSQMNVSPVGQGKKEMDRKKRAAGKIASYYILAKARRELTEAGVLGEQIRSYSFTDVTSRLEDVSVQDASDLVFRALGMRGQGRVQTARHLPRERYEQRVLLSCLLVALHPDAVMEDKNRTPGSIDTIAVHAARRLLLRLHVGSLGALADAWVQWKKTFVSWKKSDKEQLLKAMVEDAVATDALRAAIDRKFAQAKGIDQFRKTLGISDATAGLHTHGHEVWLEEINLKQKKTRQAILKLAGSNGEERLDAALAASKHIGDEQLAHEIMVDQTGLLNQVQEGSKVPDAVWERLRTELNSSPPHHDELVARLNRISEVLNSMVDECFTLSSVKIPNELDADFAVSIILKAEAALRKCQSQNYDDALSVWVENAISRLQSGGSDFVSNVVEILKGLCEFVRTVQVDVLLYRIRHAAPVIQQFGPAWERSYFQGHVMAGRFSADLPRTKRLLVSTLETFVENAGALRLDLETKRLDAMRVLLANAVVHLAMKQTVCTEEDVPEIMHLDLRRIIGWQNDAQKLTLVACLDNVGRQLLQEKGLTRRVEDIKELVEVCGREDLRLVDVQDHFISFMRTTMKRSDASLSNADESFLRTMVGRMTMPGEKTFALLHKRVGRAILHASIKRSQESEERRGPLGLEAVEQEVKDVAEGVASLVAHVISVYGSSLPKLLEP